jgi:hypothetical protein
VVQGSKIGQAWLQLKTGGPLVDYRVLRKGGICVWIMLAWHKAFRWTKKSRIAIELPRDGMSMNESYLEAEQRSERTTTSAHLSMSSSVNLT